MAKIKKSFIFIPLLITVLLIIFGITVLVANQSNEIKIYTASEFVRFLEHNADKTERNAVLYADIRLERKIEPKDLACELDGNGHTLTVKTTGVPYLFTKVTETGKVKNLVLAGKEGNTDDEVTAGIALQNLGAIENCIVRADFSGNGFVSGICHTNNGRLLNCLVRSKESGEKDLRYVWNPICADNYGSVKYCRYTNASSGSYDTAGEFVSGDEIKSGNTTKALNEYAKATPGLVGWKTDEQGYPTLKPEDGSQAASAFSDGNGVFLVCFIILIVAVPIVTIIYADEQKKKVFYNKREG